LIIREVAWSEVRGVMRQEYLSGNAIGFDRGETEQSIPDRFARIAARYPARLAARDGAVSLDYRQLDAASNGVRIDLPAIEAALNGQPGVDRALVAVREDRPGVQRLIAYLVTADGADVRVSGLRSALARSLPETMIPARFIVLDSFPLDRNRKLDRRALPPPDRTRPRLDAPFVAPATDRQCAIAQCFGEVLGVDGVGLNDDFFELGGDSLLATELLLAIEDRLRVLCPSDFLYSSPTVAGMDRSFDDETRAGDLVTLQPGGSRPALFCIHGTSGYVLEFRNLARLMGPDFPVYGIQNRAVIAANPDQILPGVDEMAAAAVAEMRRAQPTGPYHLCGNCYGGVIALETARRLRSTGHAVGFLGLIDTAFPTGILRAYGPLRPAREYWNELAQVPPGQRIGYAAERARSYLSRIWRHGWRHLRLLTGSRSKTARSAAIGLQETEERHFARSRFRVKAYDGPVTLFSAGRPDSRARWRGIAPQLRVIDLGGSSPPARRPHLVSEPHVCELATALREILGD
jgi:thioesterase domain-containing protein/acyl carrier protein